MDSPVNSITPAVNTTTQKKKKPSKYDKPYVAAQNPYTKKIEDQQKKEKHEANVAGAKKMASTFVNNFLPGPIKNAISAVKSLGTNIKNYETKQNNPVKDSKEMANLKTQSANWQNWEDIRKKAHEGDMDARRQYNRYLRNQERQEASRLLGVDITKK